LKKYILFIGAFFFLIVANINVSATSDPFGDIWYLKGSELNAAWEHYYGTDKGYLDIISFEYSISGSEVTLTMETSKDIVDDLETAYYMHLVYGENYYSAYYTNGVGRLGKIIQGRLPDYTTEIISPVSGSTFTATFTVDDSDIDYEIRAYTHELSTFEDTANADQWGDWIPNDYFYTFTGTEKEETEENDSTTDGGDNDVNTANDEESAENTGSDNKETPGFEILTIIAAVGVVFIFLRKRKK
jgi:hypothetical protein